MMTHESEGHKTIYIISDGIGQSASNILQACLIQFNLPSSLLHVFSRVTDPNELRNILDTAKERDAFVAFTIAKTDNRNLVHEICQQKEIVYHDILGPPLEKLASYLGSAPKEDPNLLRRVDSNYFKRIDAIEFTMKYDDGVDGTKVTQADIVILGLSRTSKTPTSFFLAQQGYKVVNIPIVPGIELPPALFEIDQSKIICLVMDPEVLQKVRTERIKHYKTHNSYTDIRQIFDEMEQVYALLKRNRLWRKIDTTNKSVEETAREIITMMFGRSRDY